MAQQAITYWQRAGNRAAKQSANQEAVAHFRNAKELLEALPDRAAHAEQELQVLAEQIEDGLRLVREAADQSGDCWFAPELHRLKGELLLQADRRDEVEECLNQALKAAQEQGARLLECARRRAWRGSGAIRASAMRPASSSLGSMAGSRKASTRSI